MGIVVTGSIAIDDIGTTSASVKNVLGGSALYFAAAASLFTHVRVVGVVGEDFNLSDLDFLVKRGVDISAIEVVRGGRTFRWAGEYEIDMNKRSTTNLELNVFETFKPVLNDNCKKEQILFLGNIDPDIQLDVMGRMESPAFVAADTIEHELKNKPESFKKVLGKINLLFINDDEARIFTGENNLFNAAKILMGYGPQTLVIKKGEHGSILFSGDKIFMIPAYPLETVVDPTGAGDSFAGGVMGYIAKTGRWDFDNLKTAVVYGGIVASFVVEGFSFENIKNVSMESVEKRFTQFKEFITL